jgi:hypothetical protein
MEIDTSGLKGKQLSEFLVRKLDELADDICQDPDELAAFVDNWRGGFYQYSFNNQLLALAQRPDATLLAGYKAWKERGREVNKGEHAIRILAPMLSKIVDEDGEETVILRGFRAVPIFAYEQTSGDPIDVGASDLVKGEFDFDTIVKAFAYPVFIRDLGLTNGSTNGRTIKISPRSNKAAMCSTLIHEVAHIKLGHCSNDKTLHETEERSVKEIEAECTSYIVTQFLGLENNKSRLYIGSWDAQREDLRGRGKKIISTAESIIKAIVEVKQ